MHRHLPDELIELIRKELDSRNFFKTNQGGQLDDFLVEIDGVYFAAQQSIGVGDYQCTKRVHEELDSISKHAYEITKTVDRLARDDVDLGLAEVLDAYGELRISFTPRLTTTAERHSTFLERQELRLKDCLKPNPKERYLAFGNFIEVLGILSDAAHAMMEETVPTQMDRGKPKWGNKALRDFVQVFYAAWRQCLGVGSGLSDTSLLFICLNHALNNMDSQTNISLTSLRNIVPKPTTVKNSKLFVL